MLTLCMDTSHRYLTCALIENNELVDSIEMECPRQQSEFILVTIDNLFKKANRKKEDLKACCITKGPGSYTGIRIAMTIAKVICSTKNLPCYTISTMDWLKGNEPTCSIVLDAKGGRCYFARYVNNEIVVKTELTTVNEIESLVSNDLIIGDGNLLGKEDNFQSLAQKFVQCIGIWEKVENIHLLTPDYYQNQNNNYNYDTSSN